MPKKIKKIAVLVDTSWGAGRAVIEGISEYASTQVHWQLTFHESTLKSKLSEWIQCWDGDGLIARLNYETDAEAIAATGLPTVDIFGKLNHPKIPTVTVDNASVARTAVDFFLAAGFTNLAFFGHHGQHASDLRQKAFKEAAQRAHIPIYIRTTSVEPSPSVKSGETEQPDRELNTVQWLQSLPKPIAILASNDVRALDLATACRASHICIPEDVAILGVNNDSFICNMGDLRLSSIVT